MTKNILFVCGTGVATSTAVAKNVTQYLYDKGLKDIRYHQTNVGSVEANSSGVDLIVSTTNIPYELDIPVINGLSIITGVGKEKTLEEIYEVLKEGE
ncbi:PTS sugar transporter subunit IIB [Aerococcus mictus]|uniref:PTS sugar transporter subunit IIB n=1 Tax=Aerococcus mictus TaxID=2976810 RepID=UPI000DCC8F51|nr:PTS sugar transporter subunit IIB [Aerococcus mictus]KAA9233753.1 PTS sugar transporter subunit IIB [Aerococcus mictus]MDL5183864.1 PTS sugar transporter subunit IIB [Aerococcus mictus]